MFDINTYQESQKLKTLIKNSGHPWEHEKMAKTLTNTKTAKPHVNFFKQETSTMALLVFGPWGPIIAA